MNKRYQRHIQLNEVGLEGQEKLSRAKVLVVGAGGLGCPALQYLAAAGIGTIGIVDFDTVSMSNLQRQVLYGTNDLGQNKALCAQQKLQQLNNEITVEAYPVGLNAQNAIQLIKEYDLVVDGSDNFVTRYLISDACILLNKPMVYGALYKFEGQVSVFNYKEGPSYRCLFPNPPQLGEVPNCNEIGVLGVLPGIIGVLQAAEALKIILGIGAILSGKILHYNALTNEQRLISFSKNEKEIETIKNNNRLIPVNTGDCALSANIALHDLSSEVEIQWIDVRELTESPQLEIPNLLRIPMNQLPDHLELLKNDRKKVVFCQSGMRSAQAVAFLERNGIKNCTSLKEGAQEIEHWLKQTT